VPLPSPPPRFHAVPSFARSTFFGFLSFRYVAFSPSQFPFSFWFHLRSIDSIRRPKVVPPPPKGCAPKRYTPPSFSGVRMIDLHCSVFPCSSGSFLGGNLDFLFPPSLALSRGRSDSFFNFSDTGSPYPDKWTLLSRLNVRRDRFFRFFQSPGPLGKNLLFLLTALRPTRPLLDLNNVPLYQYERCDTFPLLLFPSRCVVLFIFPGAISPPFLPNS